MKCEERSSDLRRETGMERLQTGREHEAGEEQSRQAGEEVLARGMWSTSTR